MHIYRITAVVDTVTLKSDYGDWHGSLDIPAFTVSAASENDALVKAKLIVDPLRMTVTHITAKETAGEQNLDVIPALHESIAALNTNSFTKRSLALLDLAREVTRLLGLEWNPYGQTIAPDGTITRKDEDIRP